MKYVKLFLQADDFWVFLRDYPECLLELVIVGPKLLVESCPIETFFSGSFVDFILSKSQKYN